MLGPNHQTTTRSFSDITGFIKSRKPGKACMHFLLLVLFFLMGSMSNVFAFQMDARRGVLTMAPVLKAASRGIVRIQLNSSRWQAGKAGPGGIGTGFVVDGRNGYILTNHHVVQGARRIYVFQNPRRGYRARVITKNKRADIAVLKIEGGALPQLTLGNSDKTEVGDLVMTVGFPFGLGRSVSMGIISAGAGPFRGPYNENRHSIQVDAAINPGNSGGPFLNSRGEVIGVNSSIMGDQGGTNLGIGFGVPINVALGVLKRAAARQGLPAPRMTFARHQQVLASAQTNSASGSASVRSNEAPGFGAHWRKPQASQGRRGTQVAVTNTNDNRRESFYNRALKLFGMKLASSTGRAARKVTRGAYVVEIKQGSVSSQAGLAPGDRIVMVDDKRVVSADDLISKLQARQEASYTKKSAKSMRIIFKRGSQHYETFLKPNFTHKKRQG